MSFLYPTFHLSRIPLFHSVYCIPVPGRIYLLVKLTSNSFCSFMKNLLRYIIARTFLTIPMVFILLSIVFVVVRVMPGDPVSPCWGAMRPKKSLNRKKRNSD